MLINKTQSFWSKTASWLFFSPLRSFSLCDWRGETSLSLQTERPPSVCVCAWGEGTLLSAETLLLIRTPTRRTFPANDSFVSYLHGEVMATESAPYKTLFYTLKQHRHITDACCNGSDWSGWWKPFEPFGNMYAANCQTPPKLPVALNSTSCSLKCETSFKSTVGEKVLCLFGDFPELTHGGVSVWQGGSSGLEGKKKKKGKKCKSLSLYHIKLSTPECQTDFLMKLSHFSRLLT